MCSFPLSDLLEVFTLEEDEIESSNITKRGRRRSCTPFDFFFMACVTVELGGTWDVLA